MTTKKSLSQQFQEDADAVEAEYQHAQAGLENMFPGLFDAMMKSVDEPKQP